MPPAERRALLLLLGLAVLGHGVLAWVRRPDPGQPPGDVRLLGHFSTDNLAAHRDSSANAARPLGPGEKVDLDRAPAAELARLPRIGPGLARRIVEDRAARGPFGSLAALSRVPGVGDGLLGVIGEHAEFSAPPSLPTSVESREPRVEARATLVARSTPSATAPIDLNQATEDQFERLPGIGPSLASRIVQFRLKRGPFGTVDSLVRVPGIGPATLARIRELVTVGR
jgi:competence protein ComEA